MILHFDPLRIAASYNLPCFNLKTKLTNYNSDHLMPQLCVGKDEAKEDEVGEEGDDADDQDDQANP